MTPIQAAYIAGILDGEGCIYANDRQLAVTWAMCDKAPLDLIGELTSTNVKPVSRLSSGGRQVWQLHVTGNKAIALLEQLLPYLLVKKEQAKLALFFPYENSGSISYQPLTKDDWGLRRYISNELKKMKAA